MLRRLHIRDYVIVDRLELEFGPGFGALTGETGAGKSILVDALSLLLGGRGDGSLVRAGRERADLSAEFGLDEASAAWLRANDFDADGDACILRRVIDASGRSRAYINGTPATLTQLRDLGEQLADLHGQHAHHALLRPQAQRELLDTHAGLLGLAADVAQKHRAWSRLRDAVASARANAEAHARERELLDWQIAELSRAGFEPAAWEEIQREHRRLAHGAALLEGAAQALEALDEGELAVGAQLDAAASRLAQLAAIDPDLDGVGTLLASARAEIEEAARDLRHYRDRLDIDPQRLAELESHIAAVTELARKHRVAPEALPSVLDQLSRRRQELAALADPEAAAREERAAREAYRQLATRLSQARAPAAAGLARRITEAMQQLAMPGGRFELALEPVEEGVAHGLETPVFLVSANPNQPLRPLAKVASGGELSRIGLAIQVITSRNAQTPTLVFDEVDVGIGGAVAEIVGRMLHDIGRERQVLCVTHLPQVAARADWQWSVAKGGDGADVVSRVSVLDREGRIAEVARMLGGVKITDTTRRHAAELLGYAA